MLRLSAAIAAVFLTVGAGASAPVAHATSAASAGHLTASPEAFVLDLGGERFDPLYAAPAGARGSEGKDLRLVQFTGPVQARWLEATRASGIEPMQYIHPYSYVVWADNEQLAELASRNDAGVRWAGDFLPTYGVQPHLRGGSPAIKNTMALISRHGDEAAFRTQAEAAGASVLEITPVNRHFAVVHLNAPGNSYLDLASIRGVYTVQEIEPLTAEEMLRGEMSNQSVVGNYDPNPPNFTIFPGYLSWLDDTGYNGDGVVVGIVDGGVRITHQDLAGNVTPCVSAGGTPTTCGHSNDDHGTHVAGAVAGTGVTGTLLNGFLRGQGVAPGASVVEQLYGPFLGGGPGGMRPNGMLTIYKESSLSTAVLTNNSWGPTGTPQGYDIPTQQIDIVTRDANPDIAGNQQILNVWSIMNGNGDRPTGACAPASVASPDEAKNLFAVGSTKLQSGAGTQLVSIFDVSANSAHGNACDGRRIPHIVAPGCSTDSTGHTSDTAHASGFCGTSMASPVVSGAVAVFIEKYRVEHGGETPSPALIKAAFTPVATDLEGFRNADNGIMGHRPDRFQGYGRLDLDAVVNPTEAVFYKEQDEVLTTGDSWSLDLVAEDPAQPIRIMLAWTDAPGHGLGGTTPAWVNNLDLEVEADGGTFLGNVVGTDGWSATGGMADDRNNLEGVFLSPDQHGGAITITVNGTNIAADALNPHDPGTPGQDFALACYNCLAGDPPPAEGADLGVSLMALPESAEAGETVTLLAQIGNFGPDAADGVELTLQLPEALGFVGTASAETNRYKAARGSDWSCAEAAGTVECTLAGSLPADTLAPGLLVETTVAGATPPGTVTVSATVGSDGDDPDAGNDSASVDVEITGVKDAIFAHDFECADGLPGCDAGGTPGVYTTREEFLANVPDGFYEEDFADVPQGLVEEPLTFTGAGISYSVNSSTPWDPVLEEGGLYNGPGFVSTNGSGDAVVITVTSGTLMAIGGNFWATDIDFAPTGAEVTIALSDGTVETFTSTGPSSFRGFVAKAPITSITIDAPDELPVSENWATIDNLIVSQ